MVETRLERMSETVREIGVREGVRGAVRSMAMRSLKAASTDRLQAGWNPADVSSMSVVRMGLRKTRSRSRDLFYNNELAKHFCRILKNNVIGPTGIRLQSKVKDPNGNVDRDANRKIEAGWKKWGKRGTCDVTGKLSWVDVLRVSLETCARDGELLVRLWRGFPNAFGFAVQLLEADLLDETYNAVLGNGNVIRMGIEYDAWDRPVAYHLLTRHPGDYMYGVQAGPARDRVPAADIIHLYLPEFVRQGRALPWLHAGMARLKKMDEYEWAELVASALGASKTVFYEADPSADPDWFDADNDEGEFIEEVEAGTAEVVPLGYRVKEYNPQHPAGNFDPFMKRQTRSFCTGAGVNYVSLGNDLSEVNFSSIRFGTEEDRDFYKMLQNWLADWLCEPVFNEVLKAGMLTGQIQLPFGKIDKFFASVWRPRRWGYVNPLQDAVSKEKQISNGLELRSSILAETTDMDYEEYLEGLQEEERLENQYGVKPPAKKLAEKAQV